MIPPHLFFFQKTDTYSSYPIYHTIYETFELVEKFYDPTFKKQLAVAQLRGALVYELADAKIIPFNIQDYAKTLENYARSIYNSSRTHEQACRSHGVSFGKKWLGRYFTVITLELQNIISGHQCIQFHPRIHPRFISPS